MVLTYGKGNGQNGRQDNQEFHGAGWDVIGNPLVSELFVLFC